MNQPIPNRICIIGAGAAGLTAAETLRELGYRDITVLEKNKNAGGKCHSFEWDGRVYEAGAGLISANHDTIYGLAEKEGIPLAQADFTQDNLYDIQTGERMVDIHSAEERLLLFGQLFFRYRSLCRKYGAVNEPGFAGLDPSLFLPFSEWARLHHIDLMPGYFERFFTGFGYGYWEEVPAAYVLKYISWDTLVSFFRRKVYTFPGGIQSLWEKIATRHRIEYETHPVQIKRTRDGVSIETNKGPFEADSLILTCALDESLHFLDAGEAESRLFTQIRHYRYSTCVCTLKDFPPHTGFIPAHFRPDKKGYPVFWYKRYADSNLYTVYILDDGHLPETTLLQNLEDTVHRLGGKIITLHETRHWKYFPHVTTSAMQAGFYDELQAIQGQRRTYYAGELLNFSMVDHTAAFARNLVQTYF